MVLYFSLFVLFCYPCFPSFSGTIQSNDPFNHYSSLLLYIISVVSFIHLNSVPNPNNSLVPRHFYFWSSWADWGGDTLDVPQTWLVVWYFLILGYWASVLILIPWVCYFCEGRAHGSALPAVIICFLCDVYLLGRKSSGSGVHRNYHYSLCVA